MSWDAMNKTRKSSKTEKKKVYRSGSLNWTGGQTPVVERHLRVCNPTIAGGWNGED